MCDFKLAHYFAAMPADHRPQLLGYVIVSKFVLAANLAINLEYVLALIVGEHLPFIRRQPTLVGHSVFRKARAFNLYGGGWHLNLQSAGDVSGVPSANSIPPPSGVPLVSVLNVAGTIPYQ
jgi:hypothetical protein